MRRVFAGLKLVAWSLAAAAILDAGSWLAIGLGRPSASGIVHDIAQMGYGCLEYLFPLSLSLPFRFGIGFHFPDPYDEYVQALFLLALAPVAFLIGRVVDKVGAARGYVIAIAGYLLVCLATYSLALFVAFRI
jgi:hypothetical protein